MLSIKEIQEEIIEEMSAFDDWMDKYNYIIELAKDLAPLNEQFKNQQYIIEGCQSKVWINAEMENDKIRFYADSDAIITKGIIALLIRVMDNQKPEDIMNIDLFFLKEIGLQENLSPNRANGLVAMIKQMKLYALAFHTKAQA